MGQYFYLFNLDKKLTHSFSCLKLGEIFDNEEFQFLLSKLYPGHEIREVPYESEIRVRFCQASGNKFEYQKLLLLAYPLIRPDLTQLVREEGEGALTSGDPQARAAAEDPKRPLGNIMDLPVEILTIIVHDVDETISVVCLSLTNNTFYEIGSKELVLRFKHLDSWIGDRIICVGDYCEVDDLPNDVFTPEEITEMKALPSDSRSLQYFLSGRSLRYQRYGNTLFDNAFWQAASRMKLIWRPLPEQKKLLGLVDIPRRYEHYLQEAESTASWALCNLTTGEFVRAEAVERFASQDADTSDSVSSAEDDEEEDHADHASGSDSSEDEDEEDDHTAAPVGPFVGDRVTFGEILGINISWSSDSSIAMRNTSDIHRGRWAGHRFELAPLDKFRRLQDGKQWRDVSKEQIKKLKGL